MDLILSRLSPISIASQLMLPKGGFVELRNDTLPHN